MSGYVSAGAAILGAGATIDSANNAKYQARLAAENQQKQFEAEALALQQSQQEALAAQQQMNNANLAQASAAAAESKALMEQQLKSSDEATNRAMTKTADTSRALSDAEQASKNGASGTMLTGSTGVAPSSLTLGKNTLLGS